MQLSFGRYTWNFEYGYYFLSSWDDFYVNISLTKLVSQLLQIKLKLID